ncbi:helix-turn-helix transcriptional regulator [Methylobacterium durans]|uniref:helix-turn-helix transcriptional regulator n=1 Tax=Methylobacterium durans TaxID=2202825 RepID=UPI0013A53411|nr:helix-turn-helix transcriptional regulator [Methylobacterium durans]
MPLGKPLLDALDSMGYGGLLLNRAEQVLRLNNTAEKILARYRSPEADTTDLGAYCYALTQLLQQHHGADGGLSENGWIAIGRSDKDGSRPLIVRAMRIHSNVAEELHRLIVLVDLDINPRPSPEVLRQVFQLTPSEARLAVEIACGRSPDEVAEAAQVSVNTIRKQLNTVFAKTNTHRQSELVALLVRLAILP